ncbi:MAG: hypothetical protein JWN14_3084 [Chthonomonadales bacterium]|nr:hypothetical protein [Chthonomonadales bacterium]
MQYQITLNIGDAGVAQINTNLGQYITVVKAVKPTPAPGKPIIAWVSTTAWDTVTITWEEEYYVYAYEKLISTGDTISLFSASQQAIVGETYPFASGKFGSGTHGQNGTIGTTNNGGSNITMGLAQDVAVNGKTVKSPINAVVVGNTELVTFVPEVTVSVFLQGYANNGVVISDITSNACTVTLTSDVPTANLSFDPNSNQFQKQ